ncbi:MAG: DUF3592 domain-containing protein [Anaerolineales bacterium]|nr:DUF3592 domain-containing protein [Anaerolineales bacterium]
MKLFISLLFFLILAGVFLWQSYRLLKRSLPGLRDAQASRSWPSVPGTVTIVSSRAEWVNVRRKNLSYFRPWVQSTYTVNGQALVCERFAFNDHLISTGTKKDAEDRIKSYQVGQTVQVYYDPTEPQKSVLEPGNISPSMSSLVGAVIFFGLALLQFVLAFLAIK